MDNLTVAYIMNQNRSPKAKRWIQNRKKIKPAHQNRCAGLLEKLFERRTAYLSAAADCLERYRIGETLGTLCHFHCRRDVRFVRVEMSDRRVLLAAVSKMPSLLKSQLYLTPVFGGLNVAVNVTLTPSPPWQA